MRSILVVARRGILAVLTASTLVYGGLVAGFGGVAVAAEAGACCQRTTDCGDGYICSVSGCSDTQAPAQFTKTCAVQTDG